MADRAGENFLTIVARQYYEKSPPLLCGDQDRLSARRTRQKVTRSIANASIRMLSCGGPVSWPSGCWWRASDMSFAHP
jgi:hypothetical protein